MVAATIRFLRRYPVTIAIVAILGVGAYAYYSLKHEAMLRTDQVCALFESSHKEDVKQLKQTYDYLAKLSPEDRKTPINVAVILVLPQTEKKAQTDTAPEFCDAPGVGLPEPDPVVPKRPHTLDWVP